MSALNTEALTDKAQKIPLIADNAMSNRDKNTEVTAKNDRDKNTVPIATYATITGLTSMALFIIGFWSASLRGMDFDEYRYKLLEAYPDKKNNLKTYLKDLITYNRENIKPSPESLLARKNADKFTVVCAVLLGAELLGGLLWQKITEKKPEEKESCSFANRVEQEKLKPSEISASR